MKCGQCPVPIGSPCLGERLHWKCSAPEYRAYFLRRHQAGMREDQPSPEALEARAMFRTQRLALATGCAAKIPEDERRGCDCTIRCLRGRSARDNGGVTIIDCWHCPDRPPS